MMIQQTQNLASAGVGVLAGQSSMQRIWLVTICLAVAFAVLVEHDQAVCSQVGDSHEAKTTVANAATQTIPIPSHWKRLGKNEIWLDSESKSVIVAGHICVTRHGLEMFMCPVGTKEHESVVAAHALASEVHAGLLAVGAKPGRPVQWEPEYKPPSGSIIEIKVTWREPDSRRLVTRWGKELVRNYHTGEGLAHDWIFGGSILEKDPDSGETYYYGDSGALICVSNFNTATIDLNVPSSSADGLLLYGAHTENLPAKGTKVYVTLTPGDFFEGK